MSSLSERFKESLGFSFFFVVYHLVLTPGLNFSFLSFVKLFKEFTFVPHLLKAEVKRDDTYHSG